MEVAVFSRRYGGRGRAQRRALDGDGVAAVAKTVEQRLDHLLVTQEFVPSVVGQVGGDEGRALGDVAFLHQLEEGVGLLGAQIQVPHLVDEQHVDPTKSIEKPARRAVGEAGVQLVEEVLGTQEAATVAALDRAQEQAGRYPGLANAGRAYQDEILGATDEIQSAQLANHPGLDAGLAIEREGGQRPFLGHARMLDATADAALDLVLVLRTK